MKKFILLYKGPATPMDQMTPEQSEKQKAAWGEWLGKVNDALTDIGAPMAAGKAVVDDGTTTAASDLNGYSIVQAEDMDAALQLVDGHPFLSDKTGEFSVEVFELLPVSM